ncbi:unnamed protein product [Bursaphelenchus xylophilus]|uniref:(pine wood nematode) hypothetical protein n=1 Tax=Bursaphelenchus xylophilus TaxID=6326 RepID=A0A1I7S0U1_BURXY|nr:unnamed protein product [Bursaphelenchus xylophilus]CAG9088443.1 unnamed protein product [Bursaphelenchus xylophilus]
MLFLVGVFGFILGVSAVTYKGVQIPDIGNGIVDRSYRFENFPALIKSEQNFNEFCQNLPKIFNQMSRADAQKYVIKFCALHGEADACNTYFADEAKKQKEVEATVEYYENFFNYTDDLRRNMEEIQRIRRDQCISIAEECYITQGLKYTLSSDERHKMHLTFENCKQRLPLKPNFAQKTCYDVPDNQVAKLPTFQQLTS